MRVMNRFSSAIAAGFLLIQVGAAHAQETATSSTSSSSEFGTFEAKDAGTGPYQGTVALGINSSGAVVGIFFDSTGLTHGFVRAANGTMTEFDAQGAGTRPNQGTFPVAINDTGAVTGTYLDAQYMRHGFVLPGAGNITSSFDAPDVTSPGTWATGINAAGEITGFFRATGTNYGYQGFVRAADGSFSTFDVSGAGTDYIQGQRRPPSMTRDL
jgi:hypothetical protein